MKTVLEIIEESNVNIEFLKHLGILDRVEKLIIETSKMHVEAALKEANDKCRLEVRHYKGNHLIGNEYQVDDYTDVVIYEDSILNSYPLENIK